MGSGQSSPAEIEAPENVEHTEDDPPGVETEKSQSKNKKPLKDLSGPALVEYKCRKKKKAWSSCVGSFYTRFSSGKALEDEEPDCDDLFEAYRQCYLQGLLKERQKKGLEPPKEGTILAEFAEEEGISISDKQ